MVQQVSYETKKTPWENNRNLTKFVFSPDVVSVIQIFPLEKYLINIFIIIRFGELMLKIWRSMWLRGWSYNKERTPFVETTDS